VDSSEKCLVTIGGVEVGGSPVNPTVLIGCMFYRKHKIVEDHRRGLFDRKEAEKLILLQEEWSDKTGIPCMVDIFGETSDALIKYLDFVSSITDKPILLNGSTWRVRISAMNHACEVGLNSRVIYTSVNYASPREEFEALAELKVKNIILQTFNPKNLKPEGALELLAGENGLLSKCSSAENILLLSTVLDLASVGVALEALKFLKEKLGYPCGIAPCGVATAWKKNMVLGAEAKRICLGGILGYSLAYGADFIIYGSIRKAPEVFHVCAMLCSIAAYSEKFCRLKRIKKSHPLFKYFSKP